MHNKSETFEHLNKNLVIIIQEPLYEDMERGFILTNIEGVRDWTIQSIFTQIRSLNAITNLGYLLQIE